LKNIWNSIKEKISSSSSLQKAFEKVKKSSTGPSAGSGGSLFNKLLTTNLSPYEKYYPYIISAALAYGAADLTNSYVRVFTIPSPQQVQTSDGPQRLGSQARLRSEFDPIARRNIFNSDGVIPPPLSGVDDGGLGDAEGPAVASSLPLELVGTIVHANPNRSVATIRQSGGNQAVIPYLVDDDIVGMATLLKVERHRVIFRNKNNGRLEFIEMPHDLKFKLTLGAPAEPAITSATGIQQNGNTFNIARKTINQHLENIGQVLQSARAVPNRDPITGEINGFRVLFIKPDSIFNELGIKPGDILQEVNGQRITSIQQAMEMYQNMRNASDISINLMREGRNETYNYNVTE